MNVDPVDRTGRKQVSTVVMVGVGICMVAIKVFRALHLSLLKMSWTDDREGNMVSVTMCTTLLYIQ
jgi:hypothetical protein